MVNDHEPTIVEPQLGDTSIQTALLPEQNLSDMSPCLSSLFLSDQATFLDSSLIAFEDLDATLALTGAMGLSDHSNTIAVLPAAATTPKPVQRSMELILRILR